MLRFHLPLIEPDSRFTASGSPTGFTIRPTIALAAQSSPTLRVQAYMNLLHDYTGFASAYVDASGKQQAKAQATNNKPANNPQPGNAIGEVIDPYTVSPGTASYIPTVSASIQLDGVGDSGTTTFSAVDSYVFTSDTIENFYYKNAPLSNALWSLTLSGSGPTLSTAAVGVNFELNPQALNEITFPPSYLASLGSYSNPTTEAALIDLSMDSSIQGVLTYNNSGEVDLPAGVSPFPAGTTYSPSGGSVEYGDAAEAVIVGVPEPATWALLMAAAVGACALQCRVKLARVGNRAKLLIRLCKSRARYNL